MAQALLSTMIIHQQKTTLCAIIKSVNLLAHKSLLVKAGFFYLRGNQNPWKI
jgi:hypothetical protein